MQQQVYWHTTADLPSRDSEPLPEQVDVAIIGGGITGLTAARTFAKRGLRTAVLESEHVGWGASSRNGGMVLIGVKMPMQAVLRKYGADVARGLFRSSLQAIDTVEQIVREEQIDCGFARTGYLLVANKPRHFDALRDDVEFMSREFGHPLRLVPRSELRQEIGSDIYFGATVDEASGGLNPAQYVVGLANAAEKACATLHTNARVQQITPQAAGFILHTGRGNVRADRVLIATAGYTGDATPALHKKLIPIGSFIIATEELPEALQRELSPRNRMIVDYKHFLNYFRLWGNRMIFGGRAAFFPENESTIGQSGEILRRELIQIHPQLKNVKVDYAWGGTLDFAFDMMTHVGEQDGLAYSLGYAGHGVALGTFLGKTVAEAMMDGRLRDHPFAGYGFPGAPLGLYGGGSPWFLPFIGLWYRILDLIE